MFSPLQKQRLHYKPKIPAVLEALSSTKWIEENDGRLTLPPQIKTLFPRLANHPHLTLQQGSQVDHRPLNVGVVLSGGQAPGGHNVIAGLFDALKILNDKNTLIGFLGGPSGIILNKTLGITSELLSRYRNLGGFDIIGSGRTKIETTEQFQKAKEAMEAHHLDGLVVIGGDDSNTNAALLAEYFLANGCKTCVLGVPKTIDGDLKSKWIEISFGFDTAAKTYAATIGSLMRDALSAKKYYYFVKLMGRSASHLTLECALQTHPNMTLISEEIARDKKTLSQVVDSIANMVCARADKGKDYGVILIPEGVVEFIPEFKILINELNTILAQGKDYASRLDSMATSEERIAIVSEFLTPSSKACFKSLPKGIQEQLLIGRDAHGNVQVSKIETERLLMEMVSEVLKEHKSSGKYHGKFDPQPHFCGYEGRSCMPSNFDSNYCYALGMTAALLVDGEATGYIATVSNLKADIANWKIGCTRIIDMMTIEKRHGENRPVIKKALVDLNGKPFLSLAQQRDKWMLDDDYLDPGAIQYYGPSEIADSPTLTLALDL